MDPRRACKTSRATGAAIWPPVEQQNSTGGETAAPVAREVLQALIGSTANS